MTDRHYALEFRPAAFASYASFRRTRWCAPGAVKLAGTDDLWRIRVGDIRVVYTVADEALVVTVVRVANPS